MLLLDEPIMVKPEKPTAQSILQHAAKAFGNAMSSASMTQKDLADVVELTTNLAICGDAARFDPTVGPARAKKIVADLAEMVAKLPLQSRRDEESERFQQFSTPCHLAFIVAWVANLDSRDVVLEPSAGTGGLCAFAINAGAKVYANEISERRVQLLRAMPVNRVFNENAEQIHNILDSSISPTAILMNPPFSTSGTRTNLGTKVRGVACAHVDQALLRLREGGRLVAIVGDRQRRGGEEDDGTGRGMATLEWWNKTRAKYSVRCSIGIPGKEYHRFGTDQAVRLWVIDKCDPTGDRCSTVDVSSVLDVIDASPSL